MSKKTLALIVGLIILIVLLVTLAGQKTNKPTTTQGPQPTAFEQTSLRLHLTQLGTGKTKSTVAVEAQTKGNKITGAQFTLSYDPKVLTNVAITPGPFLKNANVMRKNINPALGTIDYIIAIPPNGTPSQGTGVLALVTFNIIPTSTGTPTTMSFTGKTLVSASGVRPSVLFSTQNATIPTK